MKTCLQILKIKPSNEKVKLMGLVLHLATFKFFLFCYFIIKHGKPSENRILFSLHTVRLVICFYHVEYICAYTYVCMYFHVQVARESIG